MTEDEGKNDKRTTKLDKMGSNDGQFTTQQKQAQHPYIIPLCP